MRSTFNVRFFIKREKLKANGSAPIFCRITIDGSEARFGTKTDIAPDLWDSKMSKAIGRSSEAISVNTKLDEFKGIIHGIYNDLLLSESDVTAEKVKNYFLGITAKDYTVLTLFERHNEDVRKLVGISKSKATYQKYERTKNHLVTFLKAKYHVSDISFKEINHLFLTDFEIFLRTACKCNPNTTAKFMRFFKRIVLIARNNGWLRTDPFANYPIHLEEVDRGYLTEGDVKKIMKKEFPTARLEQVRGKHGEVDPLKTVQIDPVKTV